MQSMCQGDGTKPELGEDALCSGGGNVLMMTRREACAIAGLSIGVLPFAGARAAAQSPKPGIRYVVTDGRHAESLHFGAVLQRQGAQGLDVTEGLTRIWSDALMPLWRDKAGAVAGLTLPETWAGLAEQARSAGCRTIMVGHHRVLESAGAVRHSVTLPAAVPGILPALDRSGLAWPQAIAEFAATFVSAAGRTPRITHRTDMLAAAPVSVTLTSWIIA